MKKHRKVIFLMHIFWIGLREAAEFWWLHLKTT